MKGQGEGYMYKERITKIDHLKYLYIKHCKSIYFENSNLNYDYVALIKEKCFIKRMPFVQIENHFFFQLALVGFCIERSSGSDVNIHRMQGCFVFNVSHNSKNYFEKLTIDYINEHSKSNFFNIKDCAQKFSKVSGLIFPLNK